MNLHQLRRNLKIICEQKRTNCPEILKATTYFKEELSLFSVRTEEEKIVLK